MPLPTADRSSEFGRTLWPGSGWKEISTRNEFGRDVYRLFSSNESSSISMRNVRVVRHQAEQEQNADLDPWRLVEALGDLSSSAGLVSMYYLFRGPNNVPRYQREI